MSFVFAERYKLSNTQQEQISIYSDTQIELSDSASIHFSDIEIENIKKYGMVKSIVFMPEFCISFAGNDILYASRLFSRLAEKQIFHRADVVDIAYEIHMNAASIDDIEFIIASMEDWEAHIDCIKDGTKDLDCSFAWIGSPCARRYFLDARQIETNENTPIYKKSKEAFRETLDKCGDASVGGFAIEMNYCHECKRFHAVWQVNCHLEKCVTIPAGTSRILDFSASNGGYSYEVLSITPQDIIVDIAQMFPSVLYSTHNRVDQKEVNNKNLFSLMLPMLVVKNDLGQWIRYR